MTDAAVQGVAASSLPAFRDAAGPGVTLTVDGASIVSDTAGANAEYRDHHPWVFQGIAKMRSGTGTTKAINKPIDSNFCRVTDIGPVSPYFTIPFCQEQGVTALGDWSVADIEAIATAHSLTLPQAAAYYVVNTRGLANYTGYIQLDLETVSSCLLVYGDIVRAVRDVCPYARGIGPYIFATGLMGFSFWVDAVRAGTCAFVQCFQNQVETDAVAAVRAVTVLQEMRDAVTAVGLSTPFVPNLNLQVGDSHPAYVEPDAPLCTAGNLIARRNAIMTMRERVQGVIWFVTCTDANTARKAAITALAASIPPWEFP